MLLPKYILSIDAGTTGITIILFDKNTEKYYNSEIKEALIFNKNLIMENFILPHRLQFPLYRKILEYYYT